MVLTWILGFALLGSVGAVIGAAAFLVLPKGTRDRTVPFLVSYATGTLLGAALLGLIPQAIEQGGLQASLGSVLAGLIVFFSLERLMIWRHCHSGGSCEVHGAAGQLILLGDALHNFVDGIVIAAAFLSSIPLGIVTGIAVIAHEMPQEVGDFAILLDYGFSRQRAMKWNLISSGTTLPGALLGYLAFEESSKLIGPMLALSAASFLYIGLADLIPGLHRRIGSETGIAQFLLLLAGVGTIVVVHMHHGG